MNCRQAQHLIVEARESLPEEVADHLRECAECRAFAAACRCAMTAGTDKVPPAGLDRRVLAAARTVLARNRQNSTRRGAPRRVLHFRRLAAAAALTALLALTLLLRLSHRAERPVAHVQPPVPPPRVLPRNDAPAITWEKAAADLEAMEVEMDLTEAQIDGSAEAPQGAAGTEETEPAKISSMSLDRLDEALTELECDLYFELQELAADG